MYERQWPAALLFLSGALKAGLTIDDALALLAKEAPEPLRSRLVSAEARAGSSASLKERLGISLPGDALALPRAALLFSQRAGGQAAPLLEQCAQTLQAKLESEDRLRALTAQNRASAWIVGLMPAALLAIFALFAPDYAAPLFQTRRGNAAVLLAAAMVAAGLSVVKRMSRLE